MDGVVMLEAVYVRINETEGANRMLCNKRSRKDKRRNRHQQDYLSIVSYCITAV